MRVKIVEYALMHKSKEVMRGGAMVEVNRKCAAYV